MLTDHSFAPSYSSEVDDLAAELYLPAMRESQTYDRISGFFSSAVLSIAWPALRPFVEGNAGRIRLLCSPRLAEEDAAGIVSGYTARNEAALVAQLRAELDAMLAEPQMRRCAQLLTALIASGVVDIRLATVAHSAVASSRRMFHDKVGVFADHAGNRVGFRGTFNETYLGLARDGNVESVDVWTSWEGEKDARRLADAVHRFDHLWNGLAPGVDVFELPQTTLEQIKELAREVDERTLLSEFELLPSVDLETDDPWLLNGLRLRAHQQRAVTAWRASNRMGLLAHATGSGKTVTGLFCIREALRDGLHPVVVVPSKLLLEQWDEEIRDVLGYRTILCGGDNNRWRDGLVSAALADGRERIIIAVSASAASDEFQRQTRRFADRILLVADEAHRLGSPQHQRILETIPAVARLGLSATPERAGDDEGTALLLHYFGGIIDTYSIEDALQDGVLAPYEYFPHFVYLADHEQDQFDDYTRKIKRQAAMANAPSSSEGSTERLKQLLIARARVVKNAMEKPAKAAQILSAMYRSGDRWLVYCDNRRQVDDVRSALRRQDIPSWEYFRGMEGDAANTLRAFESNGGVVVSIRCLDEGVDIPASDHALILASSRNPREHIQRRGRVLRRQPFKTLATLVDVLTLPRTLDLDDGTIGTVTGEIARAAEFASWSVTRSANMLLREKWIALGLALDDLPGVLDAGFEDDGAEDTQ